MRIHAIGWTNNISETAVRSNVGKERVCILWYDKMRWKWVAVYLPRGLPNIYSTSLCPPPQPLYLRTLKVAPYHYIWRPSYSKVADTVGGQDRVNCEMDMEAVINRVWKCTWRPWSGQFGDALRGRDRGSLKMHFESVIEQIWGYTMWPWLGQFGDAVEDWDWVNSEIYLEAVSKQVWTSNWRRSIWSEARCQLRLYSLVKL
jgi:hypothetical protein